MKNSVTDRNSTHPIGALKGQDIKTLSYEHALAALQERVKELTCLYGIAKLVETPNISLEEILRGIAELLPPAWQYPKITFGRIILDGRTYLSSEFKDERHTQNSNIIVNGARRGVVEVVYTENRTELDEGPFLKEERSLVDAVAREVSLIIGRREAQEEKAKLQDQLRHSDRLATIGQLASGVAHELNEPLGNILGFAQLVKKYPGIPEQASGDLDKIVNASLRARGIIQKLMVFARQMPPQKIRTNLNTLIEEGLSFFESRFSNKGVDLVCSLSGDLPEITCDPSQLQQVLINLVVNALQAMSEGGRLEVRTKAYKDYVSLIVEDAGSGMSEEVVKQIFLPFFTTKDVNQGTGLGLAVVHGIVSAHGGTIQVESEVDQGSRFEIRLPVNGPKDTEKNE